MPQVTLGLSLHRPEMTPLIFAHMRRHEAIFLEEPPDIGFEPMLGARSIIYSKIFAKDELTDDLSRFPHLRDELDCIRITKQLSMADCRRLFPLVRRVKGSEARKIVVEYLAELMPKTDTDFQYRKGGRTPGDDIGTV